MSRKGYIYLTENLLNGKIYIGKTSRNIPDYLGSGLRLKRAINKYGRNNFKKRILCFCNTEAKLDRKEKYYILKYDSINKGYNLTQGGEGGDTFTFNPNKEIIRNKFKSKKLSQSTRDKIGKIHKGIPKSDITKNRIRESRLGHLVTESTRRKISINTRKAMARKEVLLKLKRPKTEEHKNKLRESLNRPEIREAHTKLVTKYKFDTNLIIELIKEGKRTKDIASHYKCSQEYMCIIIKKLLGHSLTELRREGVK